MPRPSFRSLRNCGMLGSVTPPAIPAPGHPPDPPDPQPALLPHAMPRASFRALRNCGMLGSVTEPAIPAPGHPPEPTEPQLASAADTFSMLASPARLHLVWLMSAGTYDVGALAEHVGLSLP